MPDHTSKYSHNMRSCSATYQCGAFYASVSKLHRQRSRGATKSASIQSDELAFALPCPIALTLLLTGLLIDHGGNLS
jgi:hypothetical protein